MININIPRLHQSTGFPCPLVSIISGAALLDFNSNKSYIIPRYSGVPTNDLVNSPSSKILAIPKSVRQIWPSSSIKMFSGFKSL